MSRQVIGLLALSALVAADSKESYLAWAIIATVLAAVMALITLILLGAILCLCRKPSQVGIAEAKIIHVTSGPPVYSHTAAIPRAPSPVRPQSPPAPSGGDHLGTFTAVSHVTTDYVDWQRQQHENIINEPQNWDGLAETAAVDDQRHLRDVSPSVAASRPMTPMVAHEDNSVPPSSYIASDGGVHNGTQPQTAYGAAPPPSRPSTAGPPPPAAPTYAPRPAVQQQQQPETVPEQQQQQQQQPQPKPEQQSANPPQPQQEQRSQQQSADCDSTAVAAADATRSASPPRPKDVPGEPGSAGHTARDLAPTVATAFGDGPKPADAAAPPTEPAPADDDARRGADAAAATGPPPPAASAAADATPTPTATCSDGVLEDVEDPDHARAATQQQQQQQQQQSLREEAAIFPTTGGTPARLHPDQPLQERAVYNRPTSASHVRPSSAAGAAASQGPPAAQPHQPGPAVGAVLYDGRVPAAPADAPPPATQAGRQYGNGID